MIADSTIQELHLNANPAGNGKIKAACYSVSSSQAIKFSSSSIVSVPISSYVNITALCANRLIGGSALFLTGQGGSFDRTDFLRAFINHALYQLVVCNNKETASCRKSSDLAFDKSEIHKICNAAFLLKCTKRRAFVKVGDKNKRTAQQCGSFVIWRRRRDSNSREIAL